MKEYFILLFIVILGVWIADAISSFGRTSPPPPKPASTSPSPPPVKARPTPTSSKQHKAESS